MENVLLRFCRDIYRYTPSLVAKRLGLDTSTYLQIERGELFLTNDQAKRLGRLYNSNAFYFYASGLQLDLLKSLRKIVAMTNDRKGHSQTTVNTLKQAGSRRKP